MRFNEAAREFGERGFTPATVAFAFSTGQSDAFSRRQKEWVPAMAMITPARDLEESLVTKLRDLKYEYRPDIRDRAKLEANFREKFEALNRVNLTDGEFQRLLDEIVTPDVYEAARSLRNREAFIRDGPDVENPEWTAEEIRQARPLMDVLPKETAEAVRRYRGQRDPQKSPTKELVSLRVDRDIVEAYRATGSGWQKRANEALRVYAMKSGLTEK